jgi:hypothetical protein
MKRLTSTKLRVSAETIRSLDSHMLRAIVAGHRVLTDDEVACGTRVSKEVTCITCWC